MQRHDAEFALILNHSVRIGRRSGFTVTSMGQRRSSGETTVISAMSCLFDYNPKGYIWKAPGQFQKVDYIMFAQYDSDLQPGDMVYPIAGVIGMTMGRIMDVMPIPDFDGNTHHIESSIERVS